MNVVILRNGKEKNLSVTLRNYEGNTDLIEKPKLETMLSASFEKPTESELKTLGIKSGIKVKDTGKGKLNDIGIANGFIITKVDKMPIKSVDDFKSQLKKAEKEGVLIEGVYPNGMKAYYGLGM